MAKVSIIPWIVKKMKKCIGIVEDTNTASRSIASGDYVIWKGDACKASSAISEGDTLSSSNLTAVTDGVGNDLKQAIANIPNIEFGTATTTTTANANINLSLSAKDYNLLAVTVTSPADYMAFPCQYSGAGDGVLGAHIVSILNAMTPLTNASVTVKYAYVKRQ